ncbi:carboxyl-terminal processing protease CtpA [Geitlerinema sp. PCC 9228]|uniref:carboxyl-terminal processing protease CtpA n=1 Tax=Geitlerinema sp. PCC 9228 TaxID=111611 RepID=UPI0008F986FF|nr:carboxyl-terminal processing protease CtpA [Geitlerinema sp. PCC 9228]
MLGNRRTFVIACVLFLQLLWGMSWWTPPALANTQGRELFSQAWRVVSQAYLDDTFNGQDWWSVRQKALRQPMETSEDAYEAIEQMLASLDDPFTRFLRPQQYRGLQMNTSGELTGVGLQIAIDDDTHRLRVVSPIEGSPAAEAGVQALDYIVEIDGTPTDDLSLEEAAKRMRGQPGTQVTLKIQHPDSDRVESLDIIRDRIALNPVRWSLRSIDDSTQIGYIRLSQFNGNATTEVANAIENLEAKGADAYILDLRNNPGGLLQAGIEVARLWLDGGTVVYTVNRQGQFGSFDAGEQAMTDAPLAVLVNQGSASASEILAGALQDNQRAQVVGEPTFGKGLIQSLFQLSDGSGLAVTVAKYETPNHRDINESGIQPDVMVPLDIQSVRDIATEADAQYQQALKLLAPEAVMAKAS